MLLREQKTSYRLGEIFANHTSHKALITRIYKQLSKLSNKTNKPIKKKGKRFEEILHQRRYVDGKQAQEKMINNISY